MRRIDQGYASFLIMPTYPVDNKLLSNPALHREGRKRRTSVKCLAPRAWARTFGVSQTAALRHWARERKPSWPHYVSLWSRRSGSSCGDSGRIHSSLARRPGKPVKIVVAFGARRWMNLHCLLAVIRASGSRDPGNVDRRQRSRSSPTSWRERHDDFHRLTRYSWPRTGVDATRIAAATTRSARTE